MSYITQLRDKRNDVRNEQRQMLDKAIAEKRDLTPAEEQRYADLNANAEGLASNIKRETDREAEDRAISDAFETIERQSPTGPRGSSEDQVVVDAFRSMLLEGNPKPIELAPDQPGTRLYQPGIERRDLSTSAPASFRPTSMHGRIFEHAVDASAVLRAGATILATDSGENLIVPRSTSLSTASIITEGSTITESDPTLSSVTLGAHKYAILVQATRELLEDTSVDLQEYLARETGQAIGLAMGNHFINGTGSGQPRGVLADSTAGVTGPTGTSTTLGTQATAGQGTDLLNDLFGSLAEPYAMSSAAAFLLRNASLTKVRNLKTSAGEPVGTTYVNQAPAPFYADAYVPAMAANAKSILCGDWSRYLVRLVNGLRFERSDEFAFDTDKVTFRAILRADGALINVDAIKHFANSAT
jgi:HK97 family phage major capsid protein